MKTFETQLKEIIKEEEQKQEVTSKAKSIRKQYGIQLWMSGPMGSDNEETQLVEIALLIVPEDKRGQGIASEVLNNIIQWANKSNYSLAIDPSAEFGTPVTKLKRFYSKFGFKPNKGKHKDYRTRYTMIYNPLDV